MIHRGITSLLLFLGIILIAVELSKENKSCNENNIIYRYLPRTLEEDQLEPVFVSNIFKTMFSQPSTWVNSINSYDRRKQEAVNKYFISQA